MGVMKQLGMSGRRGASSVMESRVMDRVLEFVHVRRVFRSALPPVCPCAR